MARLFGDPEHWLDCNVFIQAKNGPFRFAVAPSFWKWLESTAKEGSIKSSTKVYGEILRGNDELSRWARKVRAVMFVVPDRNVQRCFHDVVQTVEQSYQLTKQRPYVAQFLSGADPWVIAHAMETKGTVVTHEVLVSNEAKDVKIPNVCQLMDVRCTDPYTAFTKLGLKL